MKLSQVIRTTLAGGIALGLAACGGGGSGDSGGDSDSSNNSTSGTITSFGSIYVNGTRYDTSNAEIYIEDQQASESDLRVGMMVRVDMDGNGNAESVHHDDDVEGLVFSNNIASGQKTGTMEVMGYTVSISNNTIFESKVTGITSVDQVAAGNIIEVSGYSTGMGNVSATRVEVKAADLATYLISHPEGIEAKGIVTAHSAATQLFNIGSMVVNYSGAQLDNLPNGVSDNLFVEVKSVQGMNASNQLVASKVELEDHESYGHHGDDGDEYEVSGLVSAVTASSVVVNGQTFGINNQTEFDDGTLANLVVGAFVEIEAYFDSQGNLIAEEIEFEDHNGSIEIKDTVVSVVINNNNDGTLNMTGGAIILVTNTTIMHDDRDNGVTPDKFFNLSDVAIGDYLEVYVVDNGDGTFTATKIEREDDPSSP